MAPDYLITDFAKSRQRGLVTIMVDGEPALEVPQSIIDKLALSVGQSLGPDAQEEVRHLSHEQQARTLAVQALGRRAYSRRGLSDRLRARGLPEPAVTAALDWLAGKGYLDDEQYARDRLAALCARRLGAAGIMQRLVAEGVARALAEQVVAEQAEALPETERACELARRQAERMAGLDWPRRRARLYQYLARRGYGSDDIATALARLQPEEDSSAEF